MHSNSHVLAIKDANGKILREVGGQVFLPFNSSYSLLLKNLNPVRSCCAVSIDGMDVLGGHELIIDAHGSINLERFLVDGDLTKGRRFMFVPLADARVQDPSASDNGIVEVRFWREWQPTIFTQPVWQPNCVSTYFYLDGGLHTKGVGATLGAASPTFAATNCSVEASMRCCSDMGAQPMSAGATVEGAASSQQFNRGCFGTKDGAPTVLRLKLVGQVDQPLTVEQTKKIHCTFCGKKVKFGDCYCGNCGMKL